MADREQKTVRVIASVNSRTLRTVNIVTSAAGYVAGEIKTCLQAAGAPVRAEYETVQDSGGLITGLTTIYIAGYSAPA